MKKLDLPGAHATALSVTDELFHQMYCFDTSDFDAGYLGAMYADLIHHALLEEAKGPRPVGADMKEIALVHDFYAGDSLSLEEWTAIARGVLGMVIPHAIRVMNNLKPRVIARVGVLLEPPEGQPIILLEFCYERNS